MEKDFFRHKADAYDLSADHINTVNHIANAIQRQIRFHPKMHLLDFGSGTGLLLQKMAPLVEHITAVDISPSMNAQLERKRGQLPCEIEIRKTDLTQETLDLRVDGVISSMTLHHIEDIPGLFSRLHGLLKPHGFIALADLEEEDGTFHEEDTGVFHLGFDPLSMAGVAKKTGFDHIRTMSAGVIRKPSREYPIFLLTAIAQDSMTVSN